MSYLFSSISIIATPLVTYFSLRKVDFFQKHPIYFSQIIMFVFVFVSYLLYTNCVAC